MIDQIWQPRILITDEPVLPGNFRLPPIVTKILAARGFQDHAKLESFLQPSMKSLKNPYDLAGMQTAVDRLLHAFHKKERIAIYADFDLDGTSGLALFFHGLKELGFEGVVPFQPKRLAEGYGFHASSVEELAHQGVRLIVTIDVGITAVEAVKKANTLGCDVIITDHHLPAAELPPALALINPNTGNCSAGLGHLCGAGVAFYLLWALRIRFSEEGILPETFDLKSVLDCFAIGTLTDMVPLVDENRVLVKHGLKVLEQTKRPGLRFLLEKLGLDQRPLSSQDVAIRFAPKLNALSRLELGLRPIDIFLEEDEQTAKNLVSEVIKSNDLRLKLQKQAESEALEMLAEWPEESFVFVASRNFHQGVVGLVATKLAQQLGCPAFVGAISEAGSITGSGRLPKDSALCLVKGLGAATEHLVRFGGHSQAAGFELHEGNTPALIQALTQHFAESHSIEKPAQPLHYDIDATLGEIDESSMNWMDHLGPFGTDFEVPLLRIRPLRVDKIHQLRGGHLRLKVFEDQSATHREAIWFFPPKPELLEKRGFKEGANVDVLCEVQWNYFAGRKTVQILVRDIRCL